MKYVSYLFYFILSYLKNYYYLLCLFMYLFLCQGLNLKPNIYQAGICAAKLHPQPYIDFIICLVLTLLWEIKDQSEKKSISKVLLASCKRARVWTPVLELGPSLPFGYPCLIHSHPLSGSFCLSHVAWLEHGVPRHTLLGTSQKETSHLRMLHLSQRRRFLTWLVSSCK